MVRGDLDFDAITFVAREAFINAAAASYAAWAEGEQEVSVKWDELSEDERRTVYITLLAAFDSLGLVLDPEVQKLVAVAEPELAEDAV